MKAKTLDKKFDGNEEILDAFDLSKAKRPNQEQNELMLIFQLGWLPHSRQGQVFDL